MKKQILALAAWGCGVAAMAAVTMTPDGIAVNEGSLELTLGYPAMATAAGTGQPTVTAVTAERAELAYGDGTRGSVALDSDGTVTLTFDPAVGQPELLMMVASGYGQGGRWRIGDRDGAFPRTQPEQAVLFHDTAVSGMMTAPTGEELRLELPGGAYWQLQDNREWQWNIFQLTLRPFLTAGSCELRLSTVAAAAGTRPVAVDRFGQSTKVDFPDKVRSEAELAADVAADRAYYDALTPPATDWYGGLPGSREKYGLEATGFFRTAQVAGRRVLVTPAGNLFFQLGVCCVGSCDDYTYVTGREEIYDWLPERDGEFRTAFLPGQEGDNLSFYIVNYIRKTGRPYDPSEWQGTMIDRLKKWGFNSQGAFGDNTSGGRERQFGVALMMPIETWRGLRMLTGTILDPFDEENRALLDRIFAEVVAPRAADELVIGYFSGNEQHYDQVGPALAASTGGAAKRAWAADLQQRYDSIAALNRAWGSGFADWESFIATPVTVDGAAANADLAAFAAQTLDVYFRLVAETFRRHDPNHLYLGERFLPAMIAQEEAVRACGRYTDVFSVNYYTMQSDPAFLSRIAALSERPVLLSEWSFGSAEQGLSGGVRNVTDQTARGLAYRHYVETAAAHPDVVGIQWFSALDQALTGRWFSRYNGESMNIGLVNVADRPFKEFLAEVMKTNYRIYPLVLGEVAPLVNAAAGAVDQVVQVAHAGADQQFDGTFRGWPARPSELVTRPADGNPGADSGADFWLSWNADFLFVYLSVRDRTPGRNQQAPADLWNADALELFFGVDLAAVGALRADDHQLLVGAGDERRFHWSKGEGGDGVQTVRVVQPDGSGYVLEVAVPWRVLGLEPQAGLEFRFDLGVDFGDAEGRYRQGQLLWNGGERNSSDRTNWGRAVLVP